MSDSPTDEARARKPDALRQLQIIPLAVRGVTTGPPTASSSLLRRSVERIRAAQDAEDDTLP